MKIYREGTEVRKMRSGDEVELGSFPQTEDGKNLPIRWIAIQVWGNPEYCRQDKDDEVKTALLISRDCLEAMPYAERGHPAVWETSGIRRWLNEEFCTQTFTAAEQSRIIRRKTPNIHHVYHPHYRTTGITYMEDSVFIPGSWLYIPKDVMCAKASSYCLGRISLFDRFQPYVRWWMLTNDPEETVADYADAEGKYQFNKGYFGTSGNDGIDGAPVDSVLGIRPAVYIRLQENEIDYDYEKQMYLQEAERVRGLCGGLH